MVLSDTPHPSLNEIRGQHGGIDSGSAEAIRVEKAEEFATVDVLNAWF